MPENKDLTSDFKDEVVSADKAESVQVSRSETERDKPRSPFIRVLAVIGALALVALSYLLFRYGYLWKI